MWAGLRENLMSKAGYTDSKSNLAGLTTLGQSTPRDALEASTTVSGLNFAETSSSTADIVFDDNDSGAYAYLFTSGGRVVQSFINVDDDWADYGSYYYQAFMHEIGHALGLGHTGNYNGSATYGSDAGYANDSWQTSVMSYFSQSANTWTDASFAFLATLQLGDIAAIQSLYGTPVNVETGNTVYGDGATSDRFGMDLSGTYAVAIVDSAGTDEINLASRSSDQILSLVAETYSDLNGKVGNFSIGRNTVIENAITGSGNDQIYGNYAGNWLDGGAGDDVIYGGAGVDIVIGGQGNDVLYGEVDSDSVFGGDGDDFVFGGEGDDFLQGSTGNDYISGGAGTDWALFELSMASYSIVQIASTIQVIGDYVDTVFEDVEWLSFFDQAVRFVDLIEPSQAVSDETRTDFYADGAEDFLWRNDNGAIYVWDMNVDGSIAYNDLGSADLSWKIAGTGDFYGDGADDFLWRNDNGAIFVWDKNADGSIAYNDLGAAALSWQIAETGDFYGDGAGDFLWRNDNGAVYVWDVNVDGSIAYNDLGAAGLSWQIAGTGDFFGDGADDFLWRNDNGAVYVWDMNVDGSTAYHDLGTADPSWQIKSTGDFFGDGADDFVWRNDNGAIYVWDMNPDGSIAYYDLGAADLSWQIKGTGDFHGDGADDFVWRNDNGAIYVWDMNVDGTIAHNDLGAVSASWSLEMLDF